MSTHTTWAVVPVKPFALAKRRLASVLTQKERHQLARLMLEDVLDALAACRDLSGTIVVTQDEEASDIARRSGCAVLAEPALNGINSAVLVATQLLVNRVDAGMIVVPSDIPHLSSSVIGEIVARISRPQAIVAVPATNDAGTNLMACRPFDAIPPSFGAQSFQRHCKLAHDVGIIPSVLTHKQVGQDIDHPADLAAFLSFKSATRTHAFLTTLDIETRLHSGHRPTDHVLKA